MAMLFLNWRRLVTTFFKQIFPVSHKQKTCFGVVYLPALHFMEHNERVVFSRIFIPLLFPFSCFSNKGLTICSWK